MNDVRGAKGLKTTWLTAQDVMDWWLQDDVKYYERLRVKQAQLKLEL